MVNVDKLEFGIETFGDIVANEDGSLKSALNRFDKLFTKAKLLISMESM